MQIEFFGAASGVTGSCHIVRVAGKQILLDCGLLQGGKQADQQNAEAFPFDAREIDAVVLSHAHIDHSGRLPLLVKRGFTGTIHCQNATRDLCNVLLLDSAGLQERDIQWKNKRLARKNKPLLEPLYTKQDATTVLKQLQGHKYRQKFTLFPGIDVQFQDAGHILGSSMVELWLEENGIQKKVVFSGDIGQYDTPILHDPTAIQTADIVLMESTYGNRLHRDREETIEEIGRVFEQARHDKGNILIPAFSIGRSQEIIYLLSEYYKAWQIDDWNIFLDSPMGIDASEIYWDYPHLYDDEAKALREKIERLPRIKQLHFTESVAESQALNRVRSGAVIIAGSGMCTGGRIIHHLKYNISRPQCHVVIVGYQAYGTLGRRLVNREPYVRIHGDEYAVRAQIHTVGGLSAHADQQDLLHWVSGFQSKPDVYLVHGEEDAKIALKAQLTEKNNIQAQLVKPGQVITLTP